MPPWIRLLSQLDSQPDDEHRSKFLTGETQRCLTEISNLRGGRNVLYYASSFLQKPTAPPLSFIITSEDINGLMATMHGMTWSKNLTLILHTPGGETIATDTIVSYLHSKFDDLEVIVPTYAMSAGTMISLASNRIIMGRQSQLGPIDPQMVLGNRSVAAKAIVDDFEHARSDILKNNQALLVWQPILAQVPPGLLASARNSLEYSERMVAGWLETRMFHGQDHAKSKSKAVASYFNDANHHKVHGRRIDRAEARAQGLEVEDLEDSQELQDAVLTLYHWISIFFERSPSSKAMVSTNGTFWTKNIPISQL